MATAIVELTDADLDTVKLPSEFTRAERDLETAHIAFKLGRAALYKDGKPLYNPDEHLVRSKALLAEFTAEVGDVIKTVREQEAAAAALEAEAAGFDPLLDGMSADDLARAIPLATFIREDAEALPITELADRLAAVAAGGDKVQKLLYLRYVGRRMERERADQRKRTPSREELEAQGEIRNRLNELQQQFAKPATEKRLKAAAIRRAARRLEQEANRLLAEADGTAERNARLRSARYANRF